MVKNKINRLTSFVDAYEKCLQSKSKHIFENFQLEYVTGSSPLPNALYNKAIHHNKDNAYIIVSKQSTHCIQQQNIESLELISINSSSLYSSKSPSGKHRGMDGANDFSTDYFDESIKAPVFSEAQTPITGTPLELHDYQQEIVGEEDKDGGVMTDHLVPIEPHEATFLISFYNIGVARRLKENTKFGIVRLWIISSGSDCNRTLYYSSLLTVVNHCDDKAHSGQLYTVNSILVTCKKYQPNKDEEISVYPFLNPCILSCLNLDFSHSSSYVFYRSSAHNDGEDSADDTLTSAQKGSDATCDTTHHSPSKGNITNKKDNEGDNASSVEVKMDWSGDSYILALPPLHASAVLCLQASGAEGEAGDLHKDLCVLQNLVHGLDEGVVKWCSGEEDAVKKRVEKLIEENSRTMNRKHEAGEAADNSVYKLQSPRELDFIDGVWIALRDCTCYSELVENLAVIFEALKSKRIQAGISRTNRTSLAQIINQSYNSSIQEEVRNWMTDNRPLQLLVEVGIEKLKMDFLNIFMESGLVSFTDLHHFLGSEDHEDVNVNLSKLTKLHHVLQLNCLLDQYTSFPRSLLFQVLRYSLKHFEGDVEGGLEVPIPIIDIYDHVERCVPVEWRCIATASVNHNDGDTSGNNDDDTTDNNDDDTSDNNDGDTSDNNDDDTTDNNDDVTSDSNGDDTSDKNEDDTSDKNEDDTSDNNEDDTSDNNGDDTSDNNYNRKIDDNSDGSNDDGSNVFNCIHISRLPILAHVIESQDDVSSFSQNYWLTCVHQSIHTFPLQ